MLRSNAFARVAKGPVGSGKSSACVKEIGRRACEQAAFEGVRRSRFAVIRTTYRELRDTTRKTFEQWIPQAAGTWHEADFTFVMKAPMRDGTSIDSEILFRSLDRPEDVRKLLSLELTGAYVNELREVHKSAIDVLETRLGRYPSAVHGGASWFGWWGDTNPWPSGHWGAKLFGKPPEGYELFTQPGGRSAKAENVENLPAGYYERLTRGKDADWISVYVDGQDAPATEGSIYGKLLSLLKQRGGVNDFAHDDGDVFTSWDLGIADSLSIWFWRFNDKRGVDLIDWYENSGEALSHYFGIVEAKPYRYLKHWLPHDARARSLQTGKSTIEQVSERWPGLVSITPSLDVDQGIEAARWLLEQETTRFHERCGEGIETLAEYRYEWDEVLKVYGKHPLHNFASHTADAFRYVACVVQASEILTRPEPRAEPLIVNAARPTFGDMRDATIRARPRKEHV